MVVLVTMMMGLMRLSILRGRAEICITSTSVSHADNRSTLSLFLIFLSLLSITWSSTGQTEGRVVNYRPIIGYNRTIVVDTYPIVLYALFFNFLTITGSPAGQTEGRVVKLGTVVECRTSSLRLWPDVCLSPSWRRKTQTGSYLMGGRRVWISRFEIDRPLSQWVEMRKIGGEQPIWCTSEIGGAG